MTQGGGLFSRLIRLGTRRIGEGRTKVNHVGLIVVDGTIDEAIAVEALSTVKRHRFARYRGKRTNVAVYRPTNLTDEELQTIVAAAERYVGRKYGYRKIAAHFLDWLLQGAYVFRRLTNDDKYPICSWVVAQAFWKAGKDFGVAAGTASPDDIWDFIVKKHPDRYDEIVPLGRLASTAAVPA
jgi:hypothetical protein